MKGQEELVRVEEEARAADLIAIAVERISLKESSATNDTELLVS